MYLNKAIDLICKLFQLQLKTGERISVEIVSGPGQGKSESMSQVRRKLIKAMALSPAAFTVKPFFLSTVEQPDVRGYGLPDLENKTMFWTQAPWMPTDEDGEYGIIFLDEFRQAGHDVQKPAAELLLNGQVGSSKLPINYMVIAASNREKDRSGVQRELAFVTNRRTQIMIEPNLDSWVEWAEHGNIHWAAIAFAKHQPGLIFSDQVPEKPGPFCTPRSFVKTSYMIGELDEQEFVEAASGTIGDGAAAQFVSFMRVVNELPDFEDIIANPNKCKVPNKDRPDAQFATTQMIAHRVDSNSAEPAFEYLKRLPREFQVSGIKSAINKSGPSLIQSKKFAGWLRKNQDLLIAANLLDPKKGL